MKSKYPFIFCLLLCGVCSCSTGSSREIVVKEVAAKGWSTFVPADVFYENSDTLDSKTIDILVRFRNDFNYDRLDFVVETLAPDSLFWRDTLSVSAGSPSERVETVSLTYTDVKTEYRSESTLNRKGLYRFRFTPLMPESPVEEVIGVGLEIISK